MKKIILILAASARMGTTAVGKGSQKRDIR